MWPLNKPTIANHVRKRVRCLQSYVRLFQACVRFFFHYAHNDSSRPRISSKSVFINRCGAYAGSLHVSVLHWYHQHVIGHHCHTNIVDMDPDLTHFQHCDEPGPGYRLHADQPWMEKYFDWRKAMPMQAWFATSGPSLINQMKYLVEEKFVRSKPPNP